MTRDASGRAAAAADGKARRALAPRSSHGAWSPASDRRDPVALVAEASRGRMGALLPLRNERMAASPFAFFRGSAVVMAADLARTPVSGLEVQLCGDAHCANFGGYATAERNVVFDVHDFDETLPGPWEWDVKRLVTSVALAARANRYKPRAVAAVTLATVAAYRRRMARLAEMPVLDAWYTRIEADAVVAAAPSPIARGAVHRFVEPPATAPIRALVARLTDVRDGMRRFRDEPPLLVHPAAADLADFDAAEIVGSYAASLRIDVAAHVRRYRLVDAAIKVVGIGSVGTHCAIALLETDDGEPLLLQIKEATRSALEAYLAPSSFAHHGERVVAGQHLMQTASDPFLGFGTSGDRHYYVRQFKDLTTSVRLEGVAPVALARYAEACAFALAHAHARSGSAPGIAGYLGRSNAFDRALLDFATRYAGVVEADHRAFVDATRCRDTAPASNGSAATYSS